MMGMEREPIYIKVPLCRQCLNYSEDDETEGFCSEGPTFVEGDDRCKLLDRLPWRTMEQEATDER